MPVYTPTVMLRRVTGITVDMLNKMGVEALILDVDNTLAAHNDPKPDSSVLRWLDLMKSEGIKIVLVSNNRRRRVLPFARGLELNYTANAMKPLSRGFKKTAKSLGLSPHLIAVVGDQVFTDIIGGNLFGSPTILVQPIREEKGLLFRLKRKIERMLLNSMEYL